MKKILSIALVAVLCLATVAATDFQITGNATLSAGFDIDNKVLTVGNKGLFAGIDIVAKKTLHTGSVEKKGEGDLFAYIKASLFAEQTTTNKIANKIDGNETAWTTQFDYDGYVATESVSAPSTTLIQAKIEEAYISNGTWQLNILGAKDGVDYAVSAIDQYKDIAADKMVAISSVSGEYKDLAATPVYGATFTSNVKDADKSFTASFGAQGENTTTSALQAGMIEAPAIKAGDNVKINAAASLISVENIDAKAVNTYVAPSAKVEFANDDVTVTAAADSAFAVAVDSSTSFDWNVDAAAKVVLVKPAVTIDAYYAKDVTYLGADPSAIEYAYPVENLLSARASYTETIKVADKDVKATFTATGIDLINNQDLSAKVEGSYDKVTASVYGGYVIGTEAWKAGAACAYAADKYTATASVDYDGALVVAAGVSSTKWIDGATVACGYKSGDLLNKKFGAVETSVVIAF